MVGSVTTDNRALDAKVRLRLDWLDSLDQDEVRILDAFAGEGLVWAEIERRRPDVTIYRTGIEKKRGKGDPTSTLYGDNMNYLPHVTLEIFDAIDLDHWGWPAEQLAVVADRVPQMHVFVTCGMFTMADPPTAVLEAADVPDGWGALVPSAWSKFHVELWDAFLADLGYRSTIRMVSPPDKGQITMVYDHLFPVGSDASGVLVDDLSAD